jgi:hypothetical protein
VVYCSDLEGHYVAVSPDTMFNIDSIALVAFVPEPSALSLLVLGGLVMPSRRRRA